MASEKKKKIVVEGNERWGRRSMLVNEQRWGGHGLYNCYGDDVQLSKMTLCRWHIFSLLKGMEALNLP